MLFSDLADQPVSVQPTSFAFFSHWIHGDICPSTDLVLVFLISPSWRAHLLPLNLSACTHVVPKPLSGPASSPISIPYFQLSAGHTHLDNPPPLWSQLCLFLPHTKPSQTLVTGATCPGPLISVMFGSILSLYIWRFTNTLFPPFYTLSSWCSEKCNRWSVY